MALLIGAVSTQDRQRIKAAGYMIIDRAPAGIAHVSTAQVIGVAQSLGIAVDEAAVARIAARVSAHLSKAAAGEIEYALDTQ